MVMIKSHIVGATQQRLHSQAQRQAQACSHSPIVMPASARAILAIAFCGSYNTFHGVWPHLMEMANAKTMRKPATAADAPQIAERARPPGLNGSLTTPAKTEMPKWAMPDPVGR